MTKKIGPRWKVKLRRRREGKTNYRYRARLLSSGKPRFVVRYSLKHVSAQAIKASLEGDLTLASAHSKELVKLGWKGGTSNVPAAYLVGLLCGYKAVKAGVKECVLDLDLYKPTPQSKPYAAVKGALDAGLEIPCAEEVLPVEQRIRGEHIAEYASKLKKEDEGVYLRRFSIYLKRGLPPEQLPEHFDGVKRRIIEQYGGAS